MYSIRLTKDEDKDRVISIFNNYVKNSMAAYPENPLPVQAWEHFKGMCLNGNLWIAEDENGEICGFAMLKPYMSMGTFSRTADLGYFIDPAHTGKGLGRMLLERLEEVARNLGIKVLVANVSSQNEVSLQFHRKIGFTECGRLPEVGKKHDKIFDIIWFYKHLD